MFRQKRWIIPSGKCLFLALFTTSIVWSKNHSFLSKMKKKSLMTCFLPKNIWEKVWFLNKNHGLSPLENVDVLHFLKLQFSRLKTILFHPEILKNNIFWLDYSKKTQIKKFRFLDKNHELSPQKMSISFNFIKLKFSCLKFIPFYPEYQKH